MLNKNQMANLKRFCTLAPKVQHAYDGSSAAAKDEFHRLGKLVAKMIAAELGLRANQYDISSNKAGIAVGGNVSLHTDSLYLDFGTSMRGAFMYRTCTGRKDYSGGANRWWSYEQFADRPEAFLGVLEIMLAKQERQAA